MTQNKEDVLLTLCKPYLLDLVSLLAEGLKYPDEPAHELTEGKEYRFTGEVLGRFNSLTYVQKAQVLSEIATWLDSANTPKETNDRRTNPVLACSYLKCWAATL